MAPNPEPGPRSGPAADLLPPLRSALSAESSRRVGALATLTIREALRSRVLLGLTLLTCVFALGSLFWPADQDAKRVILVQRLCYGALTFFGLIAAAFLGGSSLPGDITSKRVYSIATKPVTRFELLLGKTLGLMGVMLIFLLLGGVITYAVTHIASARKSYPGGSYTLEVTVPRAVVQAGEDSTYVEQGQILVATEHRDGRYDVRIAGRDEEVVGTIPESAVRLHERSLELQRVAPATQVRARCSGEVLPSLNELFLWCRKTVRDGDGNVAGILYDKLAAGDEWTFDVAGYTGRGKGNEVNVRMRFLLLLHERRLARNVERKLPRVQFVFRNTVSSVTANKEVEFQFVPTEHRPGATRGRSLNQYEAVFALPRGLVGAGKLVAKVEDYTPKYPEAGRVFYTRVKSPTWQLKGFSSSDLPRGVQTIRAQFFVHSMEGQDLFDHTTLTATVRNPVTNQSVDVRLPLRDKTTSFLRFPRELIHDREGVEVTLSGLKPKLRIGHRSGESPFYLALRPGSFWASTARSVGLIFLHLSLFAVLAVAGSTFVSAPVAILLTLVIALSGMVKDLLLGTRSAAELAMPEGPPDLAAAVRIVALILIALPLLLAPFLLARHRTGRGVLGACAAGLFAYLAFFGSPSNATILVLAIPLSLALLLVAQDRRIRIVLGGSLVATFLALLASGLLPFMMLAGEGGQVPLQDTVVLWTEQVFANLLVSLAPGLAQFSSTDFVSRGWAVPWSTVGSAASYALIYMVICFYLGYLMFRAREFE